MGHLINPVSFRLGVTSYWRSSYVHYFGKHKEYNYYFFLDKLLINFLSWLVKINWYASSLFLPFFHLTQKNFLFKKFIFNNTFISNLKLFDFFFLSTSLSELRLNKNLDFFSFDFNNSFLVSFVSDESDLNFVNYLVDSFYLSTCVLFDNDSKNFDLKKEIWSRRKNIFPEISHFNIYYSGFYNVKIYLYFQNREFVSYILKDIVNESINLKLDVQSYFYDIYKEIFNNYILKIYYPLFLYILFFRFFNWFYFFFIVFKDFQSDFFFQFNGLKKKIFVILFYLIDGFFIKNSKRIFYNFDIFDSMLFYFQLFLKKIFFRRSSLNIKYYFLLKDKTFFLNKFFNFLVQNFFEGYFLYFFQKLFNSFFLPLRINLVFKLMENNTISSRLIFNFFIRNLRTRKPIGRLVNFILNDIVLLTGLLGFKVLTSGRFTRKERAFYKWISIKRSPLSTYNSVLDYYVGVFKSRFGICGIKIWLFKKIN